MDGRSDYLVEGRSGQGSFYFLFKFSPDLIGLAVSEFWIRGDVSQSGWSETFETAIKCRDDIPNGDASSRSGQSVASMRTLLGGNNTMAFEDLENLMKVVFRHIFQSGQIMHGKLAVFGERSDSSETIISFFGDAHIFAWYKLFLYRTYLVQIIAKRD